MENSTKALLIAASVLIVIIIMSVGLNLFTSTSKISDQVDSSSSTMATSVFNAQFTPYLSNSISGKKVKSLLSNISTNNSASEQKVYINFYKRGHRKFGVGHFNTAAELQTVYDNIIDSDMYKVEVSTTCKKFTDGYDNGYIGCISIDQL